tara:strand:- start:5514 stop:7868 length:2355 start_codon:yes stop_codon:yes gene_type:complete
MKNQIYIISILFNLVLAKNNAEELINNSISSDFWVRRTVLDEKSRMITVSFGNQLYMAYDLANSELYKVWSGGVIWEGAAINDIKTVQPRTWGISYEQELNPEFYWMEENGKDKKPLKAFYKGYVLEHEKITFKYVVTLSSGEVIKIDEQPLLELKDNIIQLTRKFFTTELPNGFSLYCEGIKLKSGSYTIWSKIFNKSSIPDKPEYTEAIGNSGWVPPAKLWLNRSGCNTCHNFEEDRIGPSYKNIARKYEKTPHNIEQLTSRIIKGSSGYWGETVMIPHSQISQEDVKRMVQYILSLDNQDKRKVAITTPSEILEDSTKLKKPGFGNSLNKIHPSYNLIKIRPDWFKPRVGAMDFLPDGSLVISTWDSLGAVYLLKGVDKNNPDKVSIKQIASGLHEPLGLKVVHGKIFVLQKQELTELIDHNGDEIIDEYRNICSSWGATSDFHEYSYGLEYKDGYFYANLGLGMRLMKHELQDPDRGSVIKISMKGNYEKISVGLRQPNGIGFGIDGELFISENQGQWVPACKIIHVRDGDFHGCQYGTGDRYKGIIPTPPAVWLPQDEIGNSPGNPILLKDGPYAGQMIHGEITHGGLKRVFLEKVNNSYQGSVFRFSQGFESGINRIIYGPDGDIYLGGVGMNGNWSWLGKQFGLEKISYNGQTTFEMLSVQALSDGLLINFTEPLEKKAPIKFSDFRISHWRYETTSKYGSPKFDEAILPIEEIYLSRDRKKVYVELNDLKKGHVIHIMLKEKIKSESGKKLWSGEAWYTLNNIPEKNILRVFWKKL